MSIPTLPIASVLEMLMHYTLTADELAQDISHLTLLDEKLEAWPEPLSKTEDCLFSCAVAVFLNPAEAVAARVTLAESLPDDFFYNLMRLISLY